MLILGYDEAARELCDDFSRRDSGVKTVPVRIGETQAKQLHDIFGQIPGFNLNGLVQRGVDLLLEIEGPVYEAAFKEARAKLKRQPVPKP